MSISKDQAREIAKVFLDASHELGTYRFANWGQLSPNERRTIEDAEWTLLNYSSDFTTTAVGIVLVDMQADLKAIMNGTARAKKAIATVQTVKDVLTVASALLVLGGAIASQKPDAIVSAAGDLLATAKGVIEKKKTDT